MFFIHASLGHGGFESLAGTRGPLAGTTRSGARRTGSPPCKGVNRCFCRGVILVVFSTNAEFKRRTIDLGRLGWSVISREGFLSEDSSPVTSQRGVIFHEETYSTQWLGVEIIGEIQDN